jgi:hypothetical protein
MIQDSEDWQLVQWKSGEISAMVVPRAVYRESAWAKLAGSQDSAGAVGLTWLQEATKKETVEKTMIKKSLIDHSFV